MASRHSLRFPLGQKSRKHIQEALVKETVLNNEVEGSEQRGCSLLEEMSVLPPLFGLSYIFEVAYSTMYGGRVLVMRKTTLRIFDEVKEQKRC